MDVTAHSSMSPIRIEYSACHNLVCHNIFLLHFLHFQNSISILFLESVQVHSCLVRIFSIGGPYVAEYGQFSSWQCSATAPSFLYSYFHEAKWTFHDSSFAIWQQPIFSWESTQVCNVTENKEFQNKYFIFFTGLLAIVDASTLGEFRMYAIPWQMSVGCQLAGFLGVLSSELSVYTLAVITLERNYAITHAMHLNKRLSLKHAGYIMTVGWIFAVSMAVLPLMGVSDYRKFAICLPFEITGTASLVYVVFLMLINGVAFLILMGCYLKMYCAIRGSQAWNSNDSRIAKRMALLVFTDFLCWSPIAFFSLTATFGLELISLEQAKVR